MLGLNMYYWRRLLHLQALLRILADQAQLLRSAANTMRCPALDMRAVCALSPQRSYTELKRLVLALNIAPGHNLIAQATVSAFVGVRAALEGIQDTAVGKVQLIGTPAEEGSAVRLRQ